MDANDTGTLQEQFFSYIFHELRTPLTVMHSYAQILQTKLPSTPEMQSARSIAATIVNQGDAIVELIEELLEASRIPLGRLNLDLVDLDLVGLLSSLIEQLPEKILGKIESRSILVESHSEIIVAGDAPRLTRAFGAILEFATQLGSAVTLTIVPTETHDQIQVKIGIKGPVTTFSEAEAAQLFDLYRAIRKPVGSKLPSSGNLDISLYVARGLLENHNGSLVYAPDLPGFIVSLPLPK